MPQRRMPSRKRALEANAYAPFAGYEKIESEVAVPEGSRFALPPFRPSNT